MIEGFFEVGSKIWQVFCGWLDLMREFLGEAGYSKQSEDSW